MSKDKFVNAEQVRQWIRYCRRDTVDDFQAEQGLADFIEALANDRDRWKAAAENMHERCQKVFDVCRLNAWKLAADICKLPLDFNPFGD